MPADRSVTLPDDLLLAAFGTLIGHPTPEAAQNPSIPSCQQHKPGSLVLGRRLKHVGLTTSGVGEGGWVLFRVASDMGRVGWIT